MFQRLSNTMEEAAVKIRLGSTASKRAFQLQREFPGMSTPEAETRASQECLASMRAEGVDIESYNEVKAWSKRFLKQR
jgi:hypothetical protein